jgi:hypothetical protein
MARYRVLQGIDYPPNKRAEVGELVTDIPATSIPWLVECGIIEDADKPTKKIKEPVKEEPAVEKVVAPIIEKAKEPVAKKGFNPDAKDGDNDGFIQDGTPHQRPVEEKE